jgi:hypothetical protein
MAVADESFLNHNKDEISAFKQKSVLSSRNLQCNLTQYVGRCQWFFHAYDLELTGKGAVETGDRRPRGRKSALARKAWHI